MKSETNSALRPLLFAAFVCAASQLFFITANARGLHYGAVTDPDVMRCDQMNWRGEQDESRSCYADLLRSDVPAAAKAEAAWALNNLQQANQWFKNAVAASPEDLATKVRWGDLFADSHQDSEAMNIYREVLADDPHHAYATLGAAGVLVNSFQAAADTYLESLISGVIPSDGALVGALLLTTRVSLESREFDAAEASLALAEELIEKNGWPPLEVYALRASADLLNNTSSDKWTKLSLAYNPRYGGIYAIPAHFYVITHRYRDAIDYYQKAVDIEPSLAFAHVELGINLLRDNQMTRARKHLEIAYERDPFSPKSVNTLRLMDSFGDFRLIDDRPGEVGEVPITLRLHKDEAAAIAPYSIKLVRDSMAVFSERYGFQLREPVVVEMYPDHEDFAVRTAGMPGLGILGATFGYVVAMDSPSARAAEQFQWGTTLWHEMAHVYTLEATNHLVPRWFSEGVSVFEEWRTGPNPGVRIPMSVYNAMRDDRFLPIAGLDEGFVRPTYEEQVIVSYMQAGLVCDFVDRYFGADKLREMLDSYRDGYDTVTTIASVLDLSPRQFDDEFARFVDDEHGSVLAKLDDWHKNQGEISNHLAAEEWDDAIEKAQQLIAIIPQYVEADSPYLAMARAHNELEQREAAIEALHTYWKNGGFMPDPLNELAEWLEQANRPLDAIAVLQSINLVDPLDLELHGDLGDLLLAAKRPEEALQAFEIAVALRPHDMATAWFRVAQAHHQMGNIEESQTHVLQALDLAPSFRPAQRLLLQLADEQTN